MIKNFGLVGRSLKHSLSKAYFDEKFFREKLVDHHYNLYEINSIKDLKRLLESDSNICGLNITIPYKEKVMELLHQVDKTAQDVGAVNLIKIKNGKLIGYNTDSEAFALTLKKWFPAPKISCATVLGTGGASKAVQHALKKLGIDFKVVSRQKNTSTISYEKLKEENHFSYCNLIINATPVGMFPQTTDYPQLPYEQLTPNHFVYDLIYNPARTVFLQKAEMRGATIKNGIQMLHIQAEKAWGIWKH